LGAGHSSSLPDWARATGRPTASGSLRERVDDFRVVECLGAEPDGDGEHDYLLIEKAGQTTHRVAGMLAGFAGVRRRDVGYCGMKDRHARTRQWFSVPRSGGSATATDWSGFTADGVEVIVRSRHRRKLRRGAHRANHFRIVLRRLSDPDASLPDRIRRLEARGAPNYFGEQRFGRHGGNLELARKLFAGRRLPRMQRSMALSAARSLIFNDVLSRRVTDGSWNRLQPGDVANLDGSGSIFAVTRVDDELARRCAAFDLHPTGPLWGSHAPGSACAVADLERAAARARAEFAEGLEARTEESRRALRMRIADLAWEITGDSLTLAFTLPAGCFATAVTRELVRTDD